MVSIDAFRKLALSLPEATEEPHFEKTSFRVRKKIFATLSIAEKRAVLKFNEIDQSVFCAHDKSIMYPVKGGWGKQGWTTMELRKISKGICKDALVTSYKNVAPKKLSATL